MTVVVSNKETILPPNNNNNIPHVVVHTNYGSLHVDDNHDDDDNDDDNHTHASEVSSSLAETLRDVLQDTLGLSVGGGGGEDCSLVDHQGTTEIPNQVFNLIKNIVVRTTLTFSCMLVCIHFINNKHTEHHDYHIYIYRDVAYWRYPMECT